jgi:glycosyltransferase involved in cell wall biosynthesis
LMVLMPTSSFPRFEGDYHGSFVSELAGRLHEAGVDVTVLAPRSRSSRQINAGYGIMRFPFMPLKASETLPERTLKRAPPWELAQLPPYLASAWGCIKRDKADVIHTHFAIPMGFVASIAPGRPTVVTCHGSDVTLPHTDPVYRPFAARALRTAGRVVAVSSFIGGLAIRLGAPRGSLEIIHTGVDTERFRPSGRTCDGERPIKQRAGLIVGTLGRLVPEKRVEDLLRAASIVSGKIDARFLVGGEGPSRPALERLAEGLGLLNITFLGEVWDALAFHRRCDIFVLASVREGLSVSLQEAMATGCVPVTVRGFGCDEIVSDGVNGYTFRPRDHGELADRILEAVETPSMGRRARETILERFDSGRNARRYVEVYEELLRR